MKTFRKSLYIILLCAKCINIGAQSSPPTYDEAMEVFDNVQDPEQKCDTLFTVIKKMFLYKSLEDGVQALEKGKAYALAHNLNYQSAVAYFLYGKYHLLKNEIDKAIPFYKKSILRLDDDINHLHGKNLEQISICFSKLQLLDSMIYYNDKSVEWNTKHDPYNNWVNHENMSNYYIDIGDFDKAEELLLAAYGLTKPVNNKIDHGVILYRLRQIASRKDDMDMMARYEKEYYNLLSKDSKMSNVHVLQFSEKLSPQEKINRYERLLEANKRISFVETEQNIFTYLVPLYMKVGKLSTALTYQNKIDTAGQKETFKIDYLEMYASIYKAMGNYRQALHFTEMANEHRESDKQTTKRELTTTLEAKYENEKKEKEIAFLKLEDEAKSLRLNQAEYRKNFFAWLAAFIGVMAIIGAYFFNKNRNKNLLLESQNKIINDNLAEKEILLKEIHHRVKNNLQVISSLLSLQSNYIKDDEAIKAIREGKNRVSSMALIHQNLYSDKNVTSIETTSYISELVDYLFDAYNIRDNEIDLVKDIQPLQVDVDSMIPIGLMANELISNALKHAYKHQQKGLLEIHLREVNDTLYLEVFDNGQGMNEEDFFESKSFGNKLIQTFKSKLGANINVQNDNGTKITIAITKYKKAA